MTPTDLELLRRYTGERCEASFAEIVRRHLGLVYGTALRCLGHRELAEEVAQSVFVDLAIKANRLAANSVLPAWLYRVTRRSAIDLQRRERRRLLRERAAVTEGPAASDAPHRDLALHLDTALEALDPADRTAIVLRFLEDRPLKEVGHALGITDDAAQKRVRRALDRLRCRLGHHGEKLAVSGFAGALSAHGAVSVPPSLLPWLTSQVVASTAAFPSTTGWFVALLMQSTRKFVVGSVLAVAIGTAVHQSHRADRLADQLAKLSVPQDAEGGRKELSHRTLEALNDEITVLKSRLEAARRDSLELMRLRDLVTTLRADARKASFGRGSTGPGADATDSALASWIERARAFKALPDRLPERTIPELRLLTEEDWLELAKEPLGHAPSGVDLADPKSARLALSAARAKAKGRLMWLFHRALRGFAEANEGRIPTTMAELHPHLMNTHVEGPASVVEIAEGTVRDDVFGRYRIEATGKLVDQPEDQVIIRELAPVDAEFDTCVRVGNGWVALGGLADFPASNPSPP